MNPNSDEEDADEAQEYDGVDEDGYSTGLHVAKLNDSVLSRKLKEQTRAQ